MIDNNSNYDIIKNSKGTKALICGSRVYDNIDNIYQIVALLKEIGYTTIIHGCARGADTMAETCARSLQMNYQGYPAKWEKYGNKAGPIRNSEMLTEGKPDIVIAFSRDFINSKGTKNMVEQAKYINILTVVIEE